MTSAPGDRSTGAVFIDAAYVALGAKEKEAPRLFEIDIEKMSDELLGPYSRLRTYYYSTLPQDPEYAKVVEQFHKDLGLGDRIEVRLGKMQRTPKGMKDRQKQVDVLITLDMYKLAASGKIDLAILVSGDGDFVPLLQATKDLGVSTMVVCVHGAYDNELRVVADQHLEIGAADLARWQLKKPVG